MNKMIFNLFKLRYLKNIWKIKYKYKFLILKILISCFICYQIKDIMDKTYYFSSNLLEKIVNRYPREDNDVFTFFVNDFIHFIVMQFKTLKLNINLKKIKKFSNSQNKSFYNKHCLDTDQNNLKQFYTLLEKINNNKNNNINNFFKNLGCELSYLSCFDNNKNINDILTVLLPIKINIKDILTVLLPVKINKEENDFFNNIFFKMSSSSSSTASLLKYFTIINYDNLRKQKNKNINNTVSTSYSKLFYVWFYLYILGSFPFFMFLFTMILQNIKVKKFIKKHINICQLNLQYAKDFYELSQKYKNSIICAAINLQKYQVYQQMKFINYQKDQVYNICKNKILLINKMKILKSFGEKNNYLLIQNHNLLATNDLIEILLHVNIIYDLKTNETIKEMFNILDDIIYNRNQYTFLDICSLYNDFLEILATWYSKTVIILLKKGQEKLEKIHSIDESKKKHSKSKSIQSDIIINAENDIINTKPYNIRDKLSQESEEIFNYVKIIENEMTIYLYSTKETKKCFFIFAEIVQNYLLKLKEIQGEIYQMYMPLINILYRIIVTFMLQIFIIFLEFCLREEVDLTVCKKKILWLIQRFLFF